MTTQLEGRSRRSVTICGTFNHGLVQVADAVDFFVSLGLTVLSPADPTFAEDFGGFLFVSSDRQRDPLLVERRHLEAVAESDLVWLVAPAGYVGSSGIAEIAYAAGRGVPIFTSDRVREPAVRALIFRVPSPRAAAEAIGYRAGARRRSSLLVDPVGAASHLHRRIDEVAAALCTPDPSASAVVDCLARDMRDALSGLWR